MNSKYFKEAPNQTEAKTKNKAVGKIIYSKSVRIHYKTEHFLIAGYFLDQKSNVNSNLKIKFSKLATKTWRCNTDH